MAKEANAHTPLVVSALTRTAGIAAGITVDAGFKTERMHMIDDATQTVGESEWMGHQIALIIAQSEVSVIDIDVIITGILQPLRNHGVCLSVNQFFADVDVERIPRAPTHYGWLIQVLSIGQ